MKNKIIAKQVIGKTVVSSTGKHLGLLENMEFVTESGELLNLVVSKPTEQLLKMNLKKNDAGDILIPLSSVKSIGDFLVIDENELV
jgi:sporulation protein YlmC with PRC-barrel domain